MVEAWEIYAKDVKVKGKSLPDVIMKELRKTDISEKLNSDPHGAGWLVKVLVEDQTELASLMSAEDYLAFIEAERESS